MSPAVGDAILADPRAVRAREFARGLLEAHTSETMRIAAIPAPSFQEARRADYLARRMEQEGLNGVAVDEVSNAAGFLPGLEPAAAPLVLSAHIDTVFPLDLDVTPRREGDRVVGPGVGDNAASVSCLLMLARTLVRCDLRTVRPLVFLFNSGEEGLGDLRGMRSFCDRRVVSPGLIAHPAECEYVVLDGMLGHLVTQGVGSRRLRVSVRTPGGHSWADFGNASAIHLAARAISRMPEDMAVFDVPTTYNVGTIRGGLSINSIAPECEMLIDLRSLGQDALAELEKDMRALFLELVGSGVQVDVEVVGERPPGQIEAAHRFIRIIREVARLAGVSLKFCAGSTDANIPLSRAWPAATLGVKRSYNAHRETEWVEVDSLVEGLDLALCLTLCLAGLPPDRG